MELEIFSAQDQIPRQSTQMQMNFDDSTRTNVFSKIF
jgi:hypothetical protein